MIMIFSYILHLKELGLDVEINLDSMLIVIYMMVILIGALFLKMNNYQKKKILISILWK